MVLQDSWLFAGTIRDNIGYGKPGATTGEITAAARAGQLRHRAPAVHPPARRRHRGDGGGRADRPSAAGTG